MSGTERILYSERLDLWARTAEITAEVWPEYNIPPASAFRTTFPIDPLTTLSKA